MANWIALLRGINVGGNNPLPMAALRSDLESVGFEEVKTYIQSGNIVFHSSMRSVRKLEQTIGRQIQARHGFRPDVIVLKPDDLNRAIQRSPFSLSNKAEFRSGPTGRTPEVDPKTVHFFFLSQPARQASIEEMEKVKADTEQFRLLDRVFYLLAPDGIRRSKLAANVEKLLTVPATARNLRTVLKIQEMLDRHPA